MDTVLKGRRLATATMSKVDLRSAAYISPCLGNFKLAPSAKRSRLGYTTKRHSFLNARSPIFGQV